MQVQLQNNVKMIHRRWCTKLATNRIYKQVEEIRTLEFEHTHNQLNCNSGHLYRQLCAIKSMYFRIPIMELTVLVVVVNNVTYSLSIMTLNAI